MSFSIITKTSEQTFKDKNCVSVSSQNNSDCVLNFGFSFLLSIKYDAVSGKCLLLNVSGSENLLFKGQPLPQQLIVEKMCKIMVKNSDDYIIIKVNKPADSTVTTTSQNNNSVNTITTQLDKMKAEIEKVRVSIIKQTAYAINDIKHKISMNSKTGILLHIGLFVASVILAFGVSNYFTGLPLKEAGNMIQMPVNIKFLAAFAVILYGIGLILKQGTFLFLQNRIHKANAANSVSEKTLIILSSLFFAGIYVINILYYLTPGAMNLFAILMPLFFTFTCTAIAIGCGYFKSDSIELSKKLNEYEYREDFEQVMQRYRIWIEKFVNSLSHTKINNIENKLFSLQIKSVGEIVLGIMTAPFLAYGVSNTLAMCFPEAAGWVRISGLRISPVFLVLATFLIIFAFFSFVNGFTTNKKIQASNVLKVDGFSDYLQHGTDIFGLQGVKKLDTEMRRSFIIGLCIIFIEFSMNISYFMQEIGGDLGGLLLSCVAALVPTALLIAETYMLSQTKFETYVCDGVLAKYDRD